MVFEVHIPTWMPSPRTPEAETAHLVHRALRHGRHRVLVSLLLPELIASGHRGPLLQSLLDTHPDLPRWRPEAYARSRAVLAAAAGLRQDAAAHLVLPTAPTDIDVFCLALEQVASLTPDQPAEPLERALHDLWCADEIPDVGALPEEQLRPAANHLFRTRHRDVARPLLQRIAARLEPESAPWCAVRLDEAITLWRQRERETALQHFHDLEPVCRPHPATHVRLLYALMIRHLGRDDATALRWADLLLDTYPERTHADDALYWATVADPARLQTAVRTAHSRFPDGDLVGRLQTDALRALDPDDAQALLDELLASPWRDPAYETAGRLELAAARLAVQRGDDPCPAISLLHARYPHTWSSAVAERDQELRTCGHARPRPHADSITLRVTDADRAAWTRELLAIGAYRAAAEIWESIDDPTDDERWLAAALRYRAGQAREAHQPTRWALYGWERLHPWGDPRWRIAWPVHRRPEVIQAATTTGVHPGLILAMMREESAFLETVRSFAGATGLMQVMPATAAEHRQGVPEDADFAEPAINILIGANVLDGLLNRWPDDIMRVAVGYNAGPGRVRQWDRRFGEVLPEDWMDAIPFPEAWHYSRRVMQSERIYRHLYPWDTMAPDE